VARVALATLLWEDRDDRRARASLRQAIFRLRGALPDVLLLDGETVALAPGRLWTDAGAFLQLAAAGDLDAAMAAWTGDFLAGEDPSGASALGEWVAAERERLRATYRRVLDRRIAQAESGGAWGDAVAAAERLAGLDPLDAAAVARLAAVLRRAGDPAAALARVDALAARRRAELDAGLPPRLTALAEELKAEVAAREAEAARAALRQLAGAGAAADADAGPAAQHDAERARLLAAWRHVGVGADPVLVTGGTGAGRTRLLADLEHAARRDGALVLAARGYAADRETPWATARLLLAPLADAPGLAGLAPAALARLATVVPAVRDAFPALPAPGAPADDWAVLEAARAAVEEVAAEVPVLVGVDDLPRADAMTRQLALALARRLPRPGLCVAAAADDGELAAMPEAAPLLDVAALHRIALAAVERADRPPAAATPAAMPTATPPTAPAAAPVATVPRARRLRVALAAAAALGVVAFGASRLVRGSWTPAADALDASLVAVAPFDVVESDLALWRHGVVDVLARRLDGAGALRTVSPTTVIRRFEGRGDPASAAALGERTARGSWCTAASCAPAPTRCGSRRGCSTRGAARWWARCACTTRSRGWTARSTRWASGCSASWRGRGRSARCAPRAWPRRRCRRCATSSPPSSTTAPATSPAARAAAERAWRSTAASCSRATASARCCSTTSTWRPARATCCAPPRRCTAPAPRRGSRRATAP
jgi:DNA-binding SARP family transcriptional activator